MRLPPTSALKAFVCAAELGQLKLAAQKLNLTESAVSHQITRLEKLLGTILLERLPTGVKLSSEGQAFLFHVQPAMQSIELGVARLRQQENNRVTVTMPQSFAASWFAPRLAVLAADLPDVDLQLLPSQRIVDLPREGVDIAIRMGEGPWVGCMSSPQHREVIYPICTAATLQKIRTEALTNLQTIVVNELHADEWHIWSAATQVDVSAAKTMSVPSFDLAANAALTTNVVAMGRSPLAELYERQMNFVRPFDPAVVSTGQYHLVRAAGRQQRPVALRVWKWLERELSRS